jgi:hypothetical protein
MGLWEMLDAGETDPAFPFSVSKGKQVIEGVGLTKREYFAGLAMQGLLHGPTAAMAADYAANAVQMADALLAALSAPVSA